jgi:hypothetical protein
MKTQLSRQDWQQLSAYLDGQLSATEKERLETRLRSQANLRSGLEEINQTRTILRSVPLRKVPHNFILTRAMVAEQTRPRSAWFPVLGFTSLVSLVLLVAVSLLFQFQAGAAPAAAPIAMQAARSNQAGAAQPTSPPMIIQWGNGGVGGGGDGSAQPLSANPPQAFGMGGGPPQVPQTNSLMNGQATPEAGIESVSAPTEAGVPNMAAPNAVPPGEAPAATSEPALAAPPLEDTPTPPAGAVAQEKTVNNQAEGPVNILGIAPTEEQGSILSTPPVLDHYQSLSAPVNFLPIIQVGLIVLAVIAGILAFLMRKRT